MITTSTRFVFAFVVALLLLLGLPAWAAVPVEGEVPCPECAGTGRIACIYHCDHGKVPCPEICIKKSDPGWLPNIIQGRAAELYGQMGDSEKPGGNWFSTAHIGQLIVYENGLPVLKPGKCPTCNGKGVIDCPFCKGSAQVTCDLCHGTKSVSASVAALFENRHQEKDHPIQLTTGVVRGEVVKVVIRTADGMLKTVPLADVVDRPAAFDFVAPMHISATASAVKEKPIN